MTKLLSLLLRHRYPAAITAAVILLCGSLLFNSCTEPQPPPAPTGHRIEVVTNDRQAFGVAFASTARKYPKGGTCELDVVYHVNKDRDKVLRDLGYTEQAAKDSFPTFAAYWTARGWPTSELLNLYEFECAWNDWVWHTDTYLDIGIYIRNNFVTQSRGWIIAPDGWYRVRFGCMTGLGHYEGKHPNVYSDRSGANPGCTPGTAIEIDHAGWMTSRQPQRNCIWASCWGMDYGVVGGMAYSEGVQIEGFRLVGGRIGLTTDPGFISNGVTMSHPGENSVVRYCMAEGFNNAGFAIIGGTPGLVDVCSAFYNCGPGFDFLGNNGLTNMTVRIPSGDNNKGGLMRSRPMDAQSVGGGTFTIISPKSESRGVLQRMFVSEGNLGQLTLNIVGGTADYNGVTCPELIRIEKGNSWAVDVTGLEFSSGVQSLVYHAESGKRLSGGNPFVGNTFGINYEGLYLKSFANMVLTTGGVVVPPIDPGPVTPPTGSMAAKASVNNVAADLALMFDGSANTAWLGKASMTVGQWVQVDYGATASRSSISFDIANGYLNSYPRTFDVQTSTDGTTWATAKAGVVGTYPTCTTTFTATSCRFIRMTVKTGNPNWLGIAAWR